MSHFKEGVHKIKFEKFMVNFDKECLGKPQCTFQINDDNMRDTECWENFKEQRAKVKQRTKLECQVHTKNENEFKVYAKILCENNNIVVNNTITIPGADTMTRDRLANIIVGADSLIMVSFLFALWLIEFLIKIDIARHESFLLESRNFAVQVDGLPKISAAYTLDQLRGELWTHVTEVIKFHPQQVQKLRGCNFRQAIEIVDIQFAMANYDNLEALREILEASQVLEGVEL